MRRYSSGRNRVSRLDVERLAVVFRAPTEFIFEFSRIDGVTHVVAWTSGTTAMSRRSNQRGNPTYVPHLANAVLAVVAQLGNDASPAHIWGTYHAAAGGISWAGFMTCRPFQLFPFQPMTTPRQPRRPANSRLDCASLARVFGVWLPHWQEGVSECVSRLAHEKML